jgi:methyl-accepting chemotaxis protein|tara:strand:- start:1738 stop:4383 length:2646 start_codon:yes stop_codon:yes gene_type:complete
MDRDDRLLDQDPPQVEQTTVKQRKAFGIAARLFLAFGAVGTLTLVLGAVAWLSIQSMRGAFDDATGRSVPAMEQALNLQAGAAGLAAAAPQLATADSSAAREDQKAGLLARLDSMTRTLADLAALGADANRLQAIGEEVSQLTQAMDALDSAVEQRLVLEEKNRGLATQVEAGHSRLIDSISPLLDEARFNMLIASEEATDEAEGLIQDLVRNDVAALRGALEALVQVNRLSGKLNLAAALSDRRQIELLEQELSALLETLDSKVASLPKPDETEGRPSLTELAAALRQLALGEEGLLATRLGWLDAASANRGGSQMALEGLRAKLADLITGFDETLNPMVEKSNFAVVMGANTATTNSSMAIAELMDSGVGHMTALLETQAQSNLIYGLLSQSLTATTEKNLNFLRSSFTTAATSSAQAVNSLQDQEIRDDLMAKVKSLVDLGLGDAGIFAIRRAELAANAEALAEVQKARSAAAALSEVVLATVQVTKDQLTDSTAMVGQEADRSEIIQLALVAGIMLAIGLIVWLYVGRNLVVRLGKLAGTMQVIADGDLLAEVPQGGRDEISAMAKSLEVFRQSLANGEEERRRNETERQAALDARRRDMLALAGSFEASVSAVVETVSSSATEMQSTAGSMTDTAREASRQAEAVSVASNETSGSVSTAASAAQELSASVDEIGRQVTRSNEIAQDAMDRARHSNDQVETLAAAAQKIGEVVHLIQDIAEQTNLLALNATIEAARAGDAGRGFAVVANEVKSLATQTAQATEEIASQIGGMQAVTGEAVGAIQSIGTVIEQMNEISSAISAAVEQQGATTQEIASTMTLAASGMQQVNANIGGVSQAAEETGGAASQVLDASSELAQQAEALRGEVDAFLIKVRAA